MDFINIEYKLKVTFLQTGEALIVPLPTNKDIFEMFDKNTTEVVHIVDMNGEAQEALAYITVVNNDGVELV